MAVPNRSCTTGSGARRRGHGRRRRPRPRRRRRRARRRAAGRERRRRPGARSRLAAARTRSIPGSAPIRAARLSASVSGSATFDRSWRGVPYHDGLRGWRRILTASGAAGARNSAWSLALGGWSAAVAGRRRRGRVRDPRSGAGSDQTCPPRRRRSSRSGRREEEGGIEKVNWPVYGYDNARTRYLDTSGSIRRSTPRPGASTPARCSSSRPSFTRTGSSSSTRTRDDDRAQHQHRQGSSGSATSAASAPPRPPTRTGACSS